MMKQFNIGVALHGFDQRSMEAFKQFFSSPDNKSFKITRLKSATDLIIVDFDVSGPAGLNELRHAHPSVPVILLSMREYQGEDSYVFSLKKPLDTQALNDLLQQCLMVIPENASPITELHEAMIQHIQNHRPKSTHSAHENTLPVSPIDVSEMDSTQLACLVGKNSFDKTNIMNPQDVMKMVFDPKRHFLGAVIRGLKRAKFENRMLELFNLNTHLVIDPEQRKVYTFVSESVLRPLCLMDLKETSTIKVIKEGRNGKTFQSMINNSQEQVNEWSWDQFLWKMSLWTARGKVPINIDVQKPVHLYQWPNLTRLQLIPHALSIATIMSNTHMRLTDIAKKLSIDPRYVFAFFTASHMLGLAGNSKRQSDTLFKPELQPASRASQSILNRMFGFLGRQHPKPAGKEVSGVNS